MSQPPLAERILGVSDTVRYVALYRSGELSLHQRPDLEGASSAESDRYEELLVNPTLLTLTRQRGEIDCGGLEYVLIRYGSFFQLVHPLRDGHASIAIEAAGSPFPTVDALTSLLRSS